MNVPIRFRTAHVNLRQARITLALVVRERAAAISHGPFSPADGVPGLPDLPDDRAPSLPSLMENAPKVPPPPPVVRPGAPAVAVPNAGPEVAAPPRPAAPVVA